jgi:hypothetical protein
LAGLRLQNSKAATFRPGIVTAVFAIDLLRPVIYPAVSLGNAHRAQVDQRRQQKVQLIATRPALTLFRRSKGTVGPFRGDRFQGVDLVAFQAFKFGVAGPVGHRDQPFVAMWAACLIHITPPALQMMYCRSSKNKAPKTPGTIELCPISDTGTVATFARFIIRPPPRI